MTSGFLMLLTSFCHRIKEKAAQGMLAHWIEKINNAFEKSAGNSMIVRLAIRQNRTDTAYAEGYASGVEKFSNMLYSWFSFLKNSIQKSLFVSALNEGITQFPYYSIRFWGCMLLPLGVCSLTGAAVNNGGAVAVLLACFLCILAVVFLFIPQSAAQIFSGSFFVNLFISLDLDIEERQKQVVTPSYKIAGAIGFVLGVFSIVTGIIPVVLALLLLIACAVAFRYYVFALIVFSFALPFLPTMVLVAGALFLVGAMFLLKLNNAGSFSKETTSVNLFVTVFALLTLLGAVTSVTPVSSIKIALVYLAFISVYFLYVKTINREAILTALIKALTVAALPVALYGIYQYFFMAEELKTWQDTEMFEDITGRVVSFFENPNVLGEYLILTMMLCIASFSLSRKKIEKVFFAGVFMLQAVCMVMTYSRGCWIGIMLALFVYLILNNRKLLWVCLGIAIVSLLFLPETVVDRFTSIGNMSDGSTSYRVYIWEGTINMLKDYWLSGIGLGSDAFNKIYPMYAYSAISAPHPHNLYLLVWTELGLAGVIGLAGLIISFYKKMFMSFAATKNKNLKTVLCVVISGMTGFFAQGMFDNVWYNYRIYLFFWMFLGIGICAYLLSRREEKQ